MAWRGLTKPPWGAIRVHLPEPKVSPRGGRPCLEDRRGGGAILWILWTGAPWRELPRRYGSPRTCWRRLRDWEETGVLLTLWRAFLAQLHDRQQLRWDEGFVDGRVVPAKPGGPKSAPPRGARARRGWFWSMARVLRWEQTWRRRPRRRSCASSRPSTQSRSAARGRLDAPAKARSACWPIGAMTATRGALGWPTGALSRASPPGATTHMRPLKTGVNCAAPAAGGSWNGPLPGGDTFAASSCAPSG